MWVCPIFGKQAGSSKEFRDSCFLLQCSFNLTWYLSHAPHVVPVITLASGRFGHTKVQFFSSTKGHIPVLGNLTHIGGVDVVSYNYLPELLMVQVPKISSWCQKIMNERRTWTFLISLFWCKNKRLVREKTSPGLEENTFLDFINEHRVELVTLPKDTFLFHTASPQDAQTYGIV